LFDSNSDLITNLSSLPNLTKAYYTSCLVILGLLINKVDDLKNFQIENGINEYLLKGELFAVLIGLTYLISFPPPSIT